MLYCHTLIISNLLSLLLSYTSSHLLLCSALQVEGLLLRFAAALNERNRKLEAVELYRRANRPTDAALLINEIAENVIIRMSIMILLLCYCYHCYY